MIQYSSKGKLFDDELIGFEVGNNIQGAFKYDEKSFA